LASVPVMVVGALVAVELVVVAVAIAQRAYATFTAGIPMKGHPKSSFGTAGVAFRYAAFLSIFSRMGSI
jgi:hypothetical protein